MMINNILNVTVNYVANCAVVCCYGFILSFHCFSMTIIGLSCTHGSKCDWSASGLVGAM